MLPLFKYDEKNVSGYANPVTNLFGFTFQHCYQDLDSNFFIFIFGNSLKK